MATETFASIIQEHASARPAAPALTFAGQTQSFAELDAETSRLAAALQALGVAAGDRVAVLSKNNARFFQTIIACNKIGAILAGLNWRLSAREIGEILADAEPAIVLADETGLALLAQLPHCHRSLSIGEELTTLMEAAPAREQAHEPTPDDVALLLYTSGTTGRPKGAMLTHRGMAYTRRLAEAWGMTAASVNLVAMPLFHIGGCGYGASTMLAGGHTVLLAEVNLGEILDCIQRYKVTNTFLVPAVVQALLASPDVEKADLSSLELLMYGASPMGDVLLRKAMKVLRCKFIHAYGMTESSGTVAHLGPESHALEGPKAVLLKSCGRALPWVELRVTDPESGQELPAGEVGELWIRSPMLMKGYWRNPEATAQAIVDGGWFRSGDAVHMDGERHVFLVDRYKDMIISGGENIYPAEIENVLNGHEAVAQVGVIGVPHPRWGETPLAVVVLHEGKTTTAA